MEKPALNTPVGGSRLPAVSGVDQVVEAIWESAVDAFVRSILVTLFGSIAIGIAGAIWEEMAPSRPPGFQANTEAEANSSDGGHGWGAVLDEHRFLIVFGVIFLPTLWGRLAGRTPRASVKLSSRLRRMTRRLSENWLSMVLGNAIGAMIAAAVVVFVQQFTFGRILFHELLGSLLAGLQSLAGQLFGAGAGNALQSWFDWYDQNQFKFTFWLFYLAAICDDLGLPNFKTLGRWLGRRFRNRTRCAGAD